MSGDIREKYANNGSIPEFRPYYAAYADLCGLLVGSYELDVREGAAPPAMEFMHKGGDLLEGVSFARVLQNWSPRRALETMAEPGTAPFQPLRRFARAIQTSCTHSLMRIQYSRHPDIQKYSRDLFEKMGTAGAFLRKKGPEWYQERMIEAISTATSVIVQLAAVFHGVQDKYPHAPIFSKKPLDELVYGAAVSAANVGIEAIREGTLFEAIGWKIPSDGWYNYDLIDLTSANGLNKKLLEEMGYGVNHGCPATMKISEKCHDILAKRELKMTTALGTLVPRILSTYRSCILPWYQGLSEDCREAWIHTAELDVLQGSIPVKILPVQKTP